MVTKPASPNRITQQRHDQVTWSGVCPGCHDYTIITQVKLRGESEDVMDRPRFGGVYLCCGGPNGHQCWHMTKNRNAKRLYEHFGPMSRHPDHNDQAAE
jgi:hypothetical protein